MSEIKVGDWVHNVNDGDNDLWDGEVTSMEVITRATVGGVISSRVENLVVIDKPAEMPAEPPVGSIVHFKSDQTTHVHTKRGWALLYAYEGMTGDSVYTWDLTLRDYGTEFDVVLEGA